MRSLGIAPARLKHWPLTALVLPVTTVDIAQAYSTQDRDLVLESSLELEGWIRMMHRRMSAGGACKPRNANTAGGLHCNNINYPATLVTSLSQ